MLQAQIDPALVRYRYRDRYRYRNIMVFSHEIQMNHLDRISAMPSGIIRVHPVDPCSRHGFDPALVRYRYRDRYRYRNITAIEHEPQKNHFDRISAMSAKLGGQACLVQQDVRAKQLATGR